MTVNVAALVIVLIGSLILRDSPLTAVQMLWVNLIMDTFAALALATEPPDEGETLGTPQKPRYPHNRDDYILSKKIVKHILCQSAF